MVDKELVKGSIAVMVLSLLSRKDMYGYEMIKELERRSRSTFSFKEGTLYPLLHSLEKNGDVYAYWEDTKLSRKRKYYHITEQGTKELTRRMRQWQAFSEGVNEVLGGQYATNCI